jgi:hypothetical protein
MPSSQVDHASSDEDHLSADTKVVRRLATLNLLAAKGWTPHLGFWEVRTGSRRRELCVVTLCVCRFPPPDSPLLVSPWSAPGQSGINLL